jgi:hypothetical protein
LPNLPLRLFDCLGFSVPLCFFVALTGFVVVVGLRFGGGGGSGACFNTGEDRKADGDGIVIVSILTASYTDTSTLARAVRLDVIPLGWMWCCVVEIKSTLYRGPSGAAGMGRRS